jgi:hypothetical protein
MDIRVGIDKLRSSYPSVSEKLDLIQNVRFEISSVPLEEFFEPVSVIDMSNKRHKLDLISPESLAAWTKHIAYSTRVRMGALEPAILSELADGRVLASMVMIRSHMEIAGLAALCEVTLMQAVHTKDIEPLRILIPKTLLGTSLARDAKKDQVTQDMLLMSEQEGITISSAIEAMDNFSSPDEERVRYRRFYALLCDYAHPNYRGVKGFTQVVREDREGWVVKYKDTEEIEDAHVNMALQMLSDNMRIGYAASELLRLARFPGSATEFDYVSASEKEMERIWTRIIQLPFDADVRDNGQ